MFKISFFFFIVMIVVVLIVFLSLSPLFKKAGNVLLKITKYVRKSDDKDET